MTDEADKADGLASGHELVKPAWRERQPWSPEDRRMLLITVGGGLAANLATVIVVAIAIGAARYLFRTAAHYKGYPYPALAYGTVVGPAAIVLGVYMRRRSEDSGWTMSWPGRMFIIFGAIELVVSVLVWLGLAAGIK